MMKQKQTNDKGGNIAKVASFYIKIIMVLMTFISMSYFITIFNSLVFSFLSLSYVFALIVYGIAIIAKK